MTIFLLLLAFVAVSVGLVWYFLSHDRGEKEPVGALWIALGFGFVGGIVAALVENLLLPSRDLSAASPLLTIFFATLAVGIIEEAAKFVPLAFFIYPRRYFNEYTDGIIYFAIAGLGFGLPENILYTLYFGAGAGFYRVLLTPLFHAATTALVGFYLIKRKLTQGSRIKIWVMLGLIMLLHGLYDFGLTSGKLLLELLSVAITGGVSVALFVFYARAQKLDRAAQVAQPSPPIPSPTTSQATSAVNSTQLSYIPVNSTAPVIPVNSTATSYTSPELAPEVVSKSGTTPAILSLICGTAGFAGVLVPIVGLVLGVAGLVLGSLSRHSTKRAISTAGLIVSALTLIVTLGAWVYYVQHG
jgi:RsiW-degrading membrane proteinase PrsW (M82 family)